MLVVGEVVRSARAHPDVGERRDGREIDLQLSRSHVVVARHCRRELLLGLPVLVRGCVGQDHSPARVRCVWHVWFGRRFERLAGRREKPIDNNNDAGERRGRATRASDAG